MIDYRNTVKSGHILSIEDPIEFTFTHKKSIIGQREVGIDTMSYQSALREAMREAPDVIMIGEIRDPETMQAALNFADTGHLVLSTLHAVNSNQALDRIINLFPTAARNKILQDLSLNLRSIVSQRLIKGVEAKRVPAVEVLINSPFVAELIVQGKIGQIKDIMEKSASAGMQTFDQSLLELFEAGNISREEALANADSRNNLEWRMNFGGGTPDTSGEYARPVESDAMKNSAAEIVAEDGEEPAAKESVLDDLKPFSTVKVDRRAR
jgi:twitching motility protein PilU